MAVALIKTQGCRHHGAGYMAYGIDEDSRSQYLISYSNICASSVDLRDAAEKQARAASRCPANNKDGAGVQGQEGD